MYFFLLATQSGGNADDNSRAVAWFRFDLRRTADERGTFADVHQPQTFTVRAKRLFDIKPLPVVFDDKRDIIRTWSRMMLALAALACLAVLFKLSCTRLKQ
ncbi:MAG TPA: hypothetical protein VJS64_08095 [Pyrinomonadaceae bacterium]|nr:hypothetical protein [Pyrinomonadaceae bacterium]